MPNKKLPPELLNEIIDCFRVEHGWLGAFHSTQTLQNFLLRRLNKWAELGLFSVFDGIRLAFRNGQNMAYFMKGHLDQILQVERAVSNLRNSYVVTKANTATWDVIRAQCRLDPELKNFLFDLEALLNMECFKPKVANQQEVSARHSLPFDRISHVLSISPPPHREVSTGREVSAPRRSLPFVRRSRGLSIPPPPRGKPPLPPVLKEPNYVVGHPVPLEPNQSDYDSIDQTQKHVPSAQEQVQQQLTLAKETTEKLAVDDPVFSQQISSHDAPQKTPQKSAWEKFRSKKPNEQPRKVEKKEEKQRKKKDDKPKWNF